LGRASTGLGLARATRRVGLDAAWSGTGGGSIAAIHHIPFIFLMTTPPAEISRTIQSVSYQEYRG